MKRIGTVEVLGVAVEVVRTTTAEVCDPALMSDEVNATYEQDTQTIRLNADSTSKASAAVHYTGHEVGHACMALSGARQYLRSLLRMSPADFDVVEENLIDMLAPAVLSAAKSFAEVSRNLSKVCQ